MRRGHLKKFGREKTQRKVLYKSLATALIEHGKIKTTLAKAKSLSRHIDKLISKSKNNSLASRRLVAKELNQKAVSKLFKELGPKFASRNGGYTKILRLPRRISDGAPMAIIEFIS